MREKFFVRFGIPNKLVTENGTQFSSAEVKAFGASREFRHVTSLKAIEDGKYYNLHFKIFETRQ